MRAIARALLAGLRSWGVLVWLLIIVGFVAWGLSTQPLSFGDILSRVSLWGALSALTLILVGKFLTILLVRNVLSGFDQDRGLAFAWYAYSLADIAKYLPGGIWGITGRLHIFMRSGIPFWAASRMLLVETLILVAFSLGVGSIALLGTRMGWDWHLATLSLVAIAALWAISRHPLIPRSGLLLLGRIAAEQTLAWLCFGSSFAILVADNIMDFTKLAGIFDVGFAAGTVAVFAPSGLGVREVVIGWLGGSNVAASARMLIEVAVIHRLIWIAADFITLIPALLIGKPKT